MTNEIECMTQDLAMKGYAESTQSHYLKTVVELIAHFGRPASQISRDELREYVDAWVAQGRSPSWRRSRLSAILFLYRKTLGRPDVVSFVSLPRVKSALPAVLSVKEVNALLNAIRKPRYQAVAMVMYGAGLRIREALDLEVRDIDGARGVIYVRHGKGDRPREAKLSPALYAWLRNYWDRVRPAAPYLFACSKGTRPTPNTIGRVLVKAAKDAWIKKHVTPHVLRHSFATHLLEQGTDVHVVSALLGHASLQSTARYARVTRRVIQQTPSPLDLIPSQRR